MMRPACAHDCCCSEGLTTLIPMLRQDPAILLRGVHRELMVLLHEILHLDLRDLIYLLDSDLTNDFMTGAVGALVEPAALSKK